MYYYLDINSAMAQGGFINMGGKGKGSGKRNLGMSKGWKGGVTGLGKLEG